MVKIKKKRKILIFARENNFFSQKEFARILKFLKKKVKKLKFFCKKTGNFDFRSVIFTILFFLGFAWVLRFLKKKSKKKSTFLKILGP